MSILKGIMHHWNKTKNDYDVIHPETDYKKITDWNEGIVATLASTGLGTLVNTLTSDSLLATMIQKVLTATGVKYNIAQNGYLCFGSLFGGLIIQWVCPKSNNAFSFPIAFTSNWTLIPCSEAPGIGYYAFLEVVRNGMTGATINTYSGSGQLLDHTIKAIAIGW